MIPHRQDLIDAITRKYLTDPEPEPPNANGHANGHAHALSDDEIIAKCREAKNAAKFAALFDGGDTSGHAGDDSRADMALASLLAFYADDPAQLERLISASALGQRLKWRNRGDYRRRTVDHALKNRRERYTPPFRNPEPEPQDDGFIYSDHIHRGFDRNKSPLPIKTVDEIVSEAGDGPSWVIENILARGALTDFSGLAKKGGKTTFWLHAIAAGARGEEHGGFPTTPAKCLYLTEQGGNFAEALRDSGLADHPDHIRIVQFKDVTAVEWERLIRQAGAETKRMGFDVLAVDTFAVFARLKGTEENDSGAVGDRMRALRMVAQTYDLAVVLIRHAGKDGTPRGSSAFEAEADICVTISRPEGRHAPTVRKIAGVGRYGEWERNIQLHEGRFISVGSDDRVEFNRAARFVRAVLPDTPEAGMKKQDMLDTRSEGDGEISAATLGRALTWLVKQGDVGEKQLMDQRGKPKVYWLAYKPPGGGGGDGNIYFNQTPTHTHDGDRNKPEGGNTPRDEDPIRAVLADPPAWLSGMIAKWRERPDAMTEPTCRAVVAHLFDAGELDTPDRWRAVVPILEDTIAS
jgi:hypothetical protein